MRFSASAGLVLVLLSGCTAGTNQAELIDCASLYAQNARNRPPLDREAVEFCNPRTPDYSPPREPPPPPPPRETPPPPPPPEPPAPPPAP